MEKSNTVFYVYVYNCNKKTHAIVMQIKVKYTNNKIITTVVLYCYNEKKSNFETSLAIKQLGF